MVWAKIDDEILDNEKILGSGVLGFALHVAAITWSCRTLTDGFVPYARVRLLLDFADLRHELIAATSASEGTCDAAREVTYELGAVEPHKIADNLVRQGLWVEDKTRGGYWLHDFLDYNPSREKVMAERARGRDRAKASFERTKGESSGEDSTKNRDGFALSSDGPDPDPDPVPHQDSLTLVGITAPQLPLTVPGPDSGVVVNDTKKPARRGHRLPEDWRPSEATQAWAKAEGVAEPCGRTLDEFRDFWRSIPGARGVKLDWDATYRNRVRQVAQRSTPPARGGGPRGDRQGLGGWTPPASTGTDDPFGGGDS